MEGGGEIFQLDMVINRKPESWSKYQPRFIKGMWFAPIIFLMFYALLNWPFKHKFIYIYISRFSRTFVRGGIGLFISVSEILG